VIERSTAAEDVLDFLLHEIAQARAVARLQLDRGDDAVGGGHADVGRDQELLERIDGLDVDGARPLRRRVGAPDDLVEAPDDLLGRAREPLTEASKDAHITSACLRLRPLLADHQRIERRPHVHPPVEHFGHLRRDRQLDAVARAQRQRGAGGQDALRDHLHAARMSGSARPRASSIPT